MNKLFSFEKIVEKHEGVSIHLKYYATAMNSLIALFRAGRVAQSVARLAQEPEVPV